MPGDLPEAIHATWGHLLEAPHPLVDPKQLPRAAPLWQVLGLLGKDQLSDLFPISAWGQEHSDLDVVAVCLPLVTKRRALHPC